MSLGYRGLIISALAAVCLAAPALAMETETAKKPVHHPVARHHPVAAPTPAPNIEPLSDDAFLSGTRPDPGSSNRYFTDTRQPSINSLGSTMIPPWQ